jgi:hypothetical protein
MLIYSIFFVNFRYKPKKINKMNDFYFLNFTLSGPSELRISSSDEKLLQSEVFKIVKNNHLLKKRLDRFRSLGIKILIYSSSHDVPFYYHARISNYFVKDWKIGHVVLFYSSSNTQTGDRFSKSYYIQVSNYRVLYKNGCEKPCTVFVEIPVKNVNQVIRKLKLIKLNSL